MKINGTLGLGPIVSLRLHIEQYMSFVLQCSVGTPMWKSLLGYYYFWSVRCPRGGGIGLRGLLGVAHGHIANMEVAVSSKGLESACLGNS